VYMTCSGSEDEPSSTVSDLDSSFASQISMHCCQRLGKGARVRNAKIK